MIVSQSRSKFPNIEIKAEATVTNYNAIEFPLNAMYGTVYYDGNQIGTVSNTKSGIILGQQSSRVPLDINIPAFSLLTPGTELYEQISKGNIPTEFLQSLTIKGEILSGNITVAFNKRLG